MKKILFQSARKKLKKRFSEKHLCPVKCMAVFSLTIMYITLLGCILLLILPECGHEAFSAHTAAEELFHSFFRTAALSAVFICATAMMKAKYNNT